MTWPSASREGPGAHRYNEPAYRHLMGRVFNFIVRVLAVPGFQDTQCGFKSFRREVAHEVFAEQTMTGWSFDVEALYIALRRGYRVVAIPIDWYFDADSKIDPVRDTLRMVRDLLRIRSMAGAACIGARQNKRQLVETHGNIVATARQEHAAKGLLNRAQVG